MDFDSEFYESCVAFARQGFTGTGSPVSLTATLATAVGDIATTKIENVPEDAPTQSPSLTSDSYPGAFSDFYGLPSNPISVYRTGDAWPVPKGPKAGAEGGQAYQQPPDPRCVAHIR